MNCDSIYVAALIFFMHFVFLTTSHGRVFIPTDASLIENTCWRTPNHKLCISSLKEDPRSRDADVTGLALIMVDVVKAKETECAYRINHLLKQRPGDQSLSSCASQYDTVIDVLIPSVNQALTLGNPKFAEDGMNGTAVEAESCEDYFSGHSPMTDLNKASEDVAAVAAAIVRILL
ncbi:cell wall / vacuolar inhibitor of fructosidase 1-like [Argentina anserina]|uniref:cell wall / vacuolar inhibitor of fructosidase 1-like n=1 Tax=Argentina anserina TaxID=57926 RepID=UPI0021769521|nr:cell wall / vacuolar inhibitor of fructosidase 1-like [Potentilla anserina]